MKAIVGLGNPGPQYRSTRHNVGWQVVDCLAQRWRATRPTKERHAEVLRATLDGEPVLLVKPLTFMNDSGKTVRALVEKDGLLPGDLLVAYDDLDLAFGRIRLRAGGSSGGHRGIRSIQQHLGQIKGIVESKARQAQRQAGQSTVSGMGARLTGWRPFGAPAVTTPDVPAQPEEAKAPPSDPTEFPRLKVGIGRPPGGVDPVEFVLATFTPDERITIDQAVERAADAVECWLREGIETAMNRFNGL